MRRALAHTGEGERRKRSKERESTPALGKSRHASGGKREPPLATEKRPNDSTDTYIPRGSERAIERLSRYL